MEQHDLKNWLHFYISFRIGLSNQDTLDLETAWAISELDEVRKCRFWLYISGKWLCKYIEV